MQLVCLFWEDRWAPGSRRLLSTQRESWTPPAADDRMPALFVAICLQCGRLTLLVYPGPHGMALAAMPATYGGLATPNTPPGVAYYLDQAQRSLSTGAVSAAVAMYRAALEHLLHDQGFTTGMLGQRIVALEESPTPPAWRERLHPDYLRVINRLGSAAVHANNGDIGQQLRFEAELLGEVRELFIELLDEVYEQPQRKQSRLSRLQQAAASFKR